MDCRAKGGKENLGELAIERWAQGRPSLLSIVACLIAASAEAVHGFCHMARAQMRPDGIRKAPDARHWMKCYEGGTLVVERSFKLLLNDLGSSFEERNELARLPRRIRRMAKNKEFMRNLSREIAKSEDTLRQAVQEGHQVWEDLWHEFLVIVRADIRGELFGNPMKSTNEPWEPDLLYFLGVYIPCWMQYGVSPKSLLERARGGNRDATLKLLRLDKVVLVDAAILKAYQDSQFSRNPEVRNAFENALQGQPLEPLSIVHVKKALGALIWRIGQDWGEQLRLIELALKRDGHKKVSLGQVRLRPMEIRHLFDAIAEDTLGGPDPDLIELYDDAWRQGLNRAKKMWPKIPTLV